MKMIIVIKWGHDNYIVTMVCLQPSAMYHRRFIHFRHLHFFYSIINFGSNHCGSSLHLNIMNDVSSAILDMDTVRLKLA